MRKHAPLLIISKPHSVYESQRQAASGTATIILNYAAGNVKSTWAVNIIKCFHTVDTTKHV